MSVFWQKRWSSKSVTAFIAINFIEHPLVISPENSNVNKTKLKTSISFKPKFQHTLFYTLSGLFRHLYKKLRGVQNSKRFKYRLIKA